MTYISGIKIDNVKPTFEQLNQLSRLFNTKDIDNSNGVQIKCLIRMNTILARCEIKKILNCSYSQIRVKIHEKD